MLVNIYKLCPEKQHCFGLQCTRHTSIDFDNFWQKCCRESKLPSGDTGRVTDRKLLHGCMTQLPAAFCRSFSFISALLLPNSFMASLLSDGWKKATIWSRRKLVGDARSDDASTSRNGDISSFGVPYRRTASPRPVQADVVADVGERSRQPVDVRAAAERERTRSDVVDEWGAVSDWD